MSQRRKYVRRHKKTINQETPISTPTSADIQPNNLSSVIPIHSTSIISEQDEDFELSVIMDMIKIQEREEKEEIQKQIETQKIHSQELEEKIRYRDTNIKDILRKIKFGSYQSPIEKKLVNLLETFMETQDMYIQLDSIEFYQDIISYLGIKDNNTKGVIRLTDDVKVFAKNILIPPNLKN